LNGELLRTRGVRSVLGGEFEDDLVRVAAAAGSDEAAAMHESRRSLPRLNFLVPYRDDLPALTKYSSLILPHGERRVVGYTEASRGCKHVCRHCPVVPIYGGQFPIGHPGVAAADIGDQRRRG